MTKGVCECNWYCTNEIYIGKISHRVNFGFDLDFGNYPVASSSSHILKESCIQDWMLNSHSTLPSG